MSVGELQKTILALPVEQRVFLAESLLSSLPPADQAWSDADEIAEVERREQEIADGKVQPISDTDLWQRIEAGRQR